MFLFMLNPKPIPPLHLWVPNFLAVFGSIIFHQMLWSQLTYYIIIFGVDHGGPGGGQNCAQPDSVTCAGSLIYEIIQ